MISTDTIFEVEQIIGLNISSIFSDYINFMNVDYQNYIDFYLGNSDSIPQTSISNYNQLRDYINRVQYQFNVNTNRLQRSDYVYTIAYIDNIFQKLNSIKVLGKFLKSSRINEYDTGGSSQIVAVSSSDTPETIHKDTSSPQNDWVDTYVKNRVYSYYNDGGNGFIIQKENKTGVQNFDINTIIDNLDQTRLSGIDFNRYFTLTDDKSDIEILDTVNTMNQIFEISLKYRKGDHLLYEDIGMDNSLMFGDIAQVNLPFIISDISKTVNLDDTIQNFNISNINQIMNQLYITAQAESLTSKAITNSVTL